MTDLPGPESQSLTVEARAHGWRVDHYLSRIFPNHSRGLFQKAIEQQTVLVNGLPVKASRRLRVNDRISVTLPQAADSSIAAENLPIEVLFEDDHLAVINKPADMVTHPGKANFTGTLAAAVQYHFDQLSDLAGQLRPGIVHRLDRDTTGVIIIAKDNQVHHRLTRQFEQRVVKKEYRALVRGVMEREADMVRTHVKVHPRVREKMIVCPPEEKSREAVTQYRVLNRFRGFTEVQLLPETGRTHQLRVHLQHLKHPIIADKLYAGHDRLLLSELIGQPAEPEEVPLIARQALHAYRLQLRHPVTDAIMEFVAPLPEDFQRTLDALWTYRKLDT
jgi:23S rRNA pseudouridine1911/1915/1917 synthase